MQPTVYILASQRNRTLYIGVTSNLTQRIWQHKNDLVEGFTEKFRVYGLVYSWCWTTCSVPSREKSS